MLKNALYLDEFYKNDCENKINYRLVEKDNDINLGDSDNTPIVSIRSNGSNLLGDQIIGSKQDAVTIKNANDLVLKTVLISENNSKNYFKFIDTTDDIPVVANNLNNETPEN